jgi:thioredoxin 1
VTEGDNMTGVNTATFTDQNFDLEVIKSDKPVMVDFWATWCGPCQMAGPVVDALADDYKGKIKIGKLDVDANQGIAQQYGVMSIPTVILFKEGKEIARKVGFAGRPMYETLLKMVEQ